MLRGCAHFSWYERNPSDMIKSRDINLLRFLTVVAIIYFVADKFGVRLAFTRPSVTVVWPPTAMMLAGFLILGYRVWPPIFVGAFLVNAPIAGSTATAVGITVASTLEGVLATYLVNRFAQSRDPLNQPETLFKFTVLAAMLSTTVSATCGVIGLSLGGIAHSIDAPSIWLTWWLADLAFDFVVVPFLLIWSMRRTLVGQHGSAFEAIVLLEGLLLVSQAMFGGLFPSNPKDYSLEFLCLSLLLWAAFRFRKHDATTAILLLSGSAVWGTFGPLMRDTPSESLLLLQAYIGVASLTTMMIAALVFERQQVAEELRHLSTTDSLTGIANYRQLIDQLQAEIERSQRTARPFAVLFLDIDGFKNINDQYGHLVGNRALRRLVEVLRLSCRAIDTPARFGGDEFVVVLPETDEAAVECVSRRIIDRLATNRETPFISVSLGVAVYPHHADTLEALLAAADRSLYKIKSLRKGREAIVS
jgi:diguanylate cyclase (GGDEF)-like protein